MSKVKVVVLATKGLTTDLLIGKLSQLSTDIHVFIEPPESKRNIIKRRIRKLGPIKTLGQVLFMLFVLPLIPKRKNRIVQIIGNATTQNESTHVKQENIQSVHQPDLPERIKIHQPDLIIINGTRILKQHLLDQIECPIVNIHVGITPKYRGVHGGYWAIRNQDLDLFGTTLHWVDKGIDTGNIIAQATLTPNRKDNFKTYPILQYCAGLDLLSKHWPKLVSKEAKPTAALTNESHLHYHPTLAQYIFGKKRI